MGLHADMEAQQFCEQLYQLIIVLVSVCLPTAACPANGRAAAAGRTAAPQRARASGVCVRAQRGSCACGGRRVQRARWQDNRDDMRV